MKRPPPRVTPPMAEETNQRAVREKRAAQVSLQVCVLYVCVCVITPACTGCLGKHTEGLL